VKILYVHNDYYLPSGEEHAADSLVSLLKEKGHEVIWYRRGSNELKNMLLGKSRAIFLSICNPKAVKDITCIIKNQKPDLVQVQNLYPLISPRVLKSIKDAGVPLIMRCPNYRLFCPTGLFYAPPGNICEKCTGPGYELWCIRKNCMENWGKSIAYALRNFVARKTDVFRKYVDVFILQSEFQRKKFIELGIPEDKISVLPGLVPDIGLSVKKEPEYISFVGRVSREKGIDDFLEAARLLPDLKFAVAGEVPIDFKPACYPKNVKWFGFLKGKDLDELYEKSEIIIVPSRWYEGFPNVVTRAMTHSVPVITTNIGVFPEIIGNDCGLTYPPGDIDALTDRIRQIAGDQEMARRMGSAGLEKSLRDYSKDTIYSKLIHIYKTVLPPYCV
jgi:glycosyltransferase involved in cell wall biosynthesis